MSDFMEVLHFVVCLCSSGKSFLILTPFNNFHLSHYARGRLRHKDKGTHQLLVELQCAPL